MVSQVGFLCSYQAFRVASGMILPPVAAVVLRPKFDHILTTQPREFIFYTMGSFFPILALSIGFGVTWEVSLLASGFFTGCAAEISRYLSPKKISHEPQKPPIHVTSGEETGEGCLQLQSSTMLQNFAPTSSSELLHHVFPGDYQVTESDGKVQIDDKNVESSVKIWLGKKGEDPLTSEELASLKTYLRYRVFDGEERKQIRQEIYRLLYPLLEGKNEEVTLPCMTGYGGEKMRLKLEDGCLVLEGLSWNSWCIKIDAEGNCSFSDSYVSIKNEERSQLTLVNPNHCIRKDAHAWFKGEWIFETNGPQLTTLKEHLQTGPAHLELLVFKLTQIRAFLSEGMVQRVQSDYVSCCNLLSVIHKKIEGEKGLQLVSRDATNGETCWILGPMWSPVVASEDSYFNWQIKKSSAGTLSLSLQKESCGRGMMGGTATRTVTLSTGETSKQLKIEVSKSGANDLDSYTSSSVYLLEQLPNQQIRVQPLGKDSKAYFGAFILGIPDFHQADSGLQTQEEIKKDMDFIMQVFATIADIQASPDTMLIDEKKREILTLNGHLVPLERLKLLYTLRQGIYGHPFVWFDEKESVGRIEGSAIHYRGPLSITL
ncbi:hypothetical protein [Simkania negevensis]|uniref:Uncharacterized protein n=1 Tax=Simkania negevensis (strain ATCC VR-1471 / DSM 27360 / Z) TaxID=331113 RepID=F8L8R7_SIMNZ|nr:hypothetical protein [Simkania negevensis]CCB89210.1 unknown protein [Simkania negevensis Z]